jgi:hypothetical protein
MAWTANLEDLKAFQQKYKSTKAKVLAKGSNDPITKLGMWVLNQIRGHNRFLANQTTTMTADKMELLNSIGFSWTTKPEDGDDRWLNMYFKLYYHCHRYNSTCVSEADGYSSRLVKWMNQQRELCSKGLLTKFRTGLLNELGMDWTLPPSPTWDDMYEELVRYHTKFGSTLVSNHINTDLAKWTHKQRRDYCAGNIDGGKVGKLNRLEFVWYAVDVDWNAMADRLDCFQQKYNSTLVPRPCGDDPPLGAWVAHQRNVYGKYFEDSIIDVEDDDILRGIANKLQSMMIPAETHHARLKRLADLGFVWDAREAQWMEMYQRLVTYKGVHNSTIVPQEYEQDQELAHWVVNQRTGHDEGTLSEERTELLNDIDFVWDPSDKRWNEMFQRLVGCSNHYGTALIPTKGYKQDPELATWVKSNRAFKKQKRLSKERIDKLEAIGFAWTVQSNSLL